MYAKSLILEIANLAFSTPILNSFIRHLLSVL
jgi:hypothetical protein